MVCDHNWLPVRFRFSYYVVCLSCQERRRVALRWQIPITSEAVLMEAIRRGVT